MKGDLKKLQKLQKKLLAELLEGELKDQSDKNGQQLERLKNIEYLISQIEARPKKKANVKRNWLIGGLIIATLTAVTWLSYQPKGVVPVKLKIFSTSLNLQLSNSLDIQQIDSINYLSISNVGWLDLPATTVESEYQDNWLTMSGDYLKISKLTQKNSGKLNLEVRDRAFFFSSKYAQLEGKVVYQDSTFIEWGNSSPDSESMVTTDQSNRILFSADSVGEIPTSILLKFEGNLVFQQLAVSEINFLEENLSDTDFSSTIVGGTGKVFDKEFTIDRGERLDLKVDKINRLNVSVHRNVMETTIEGRFKRIDLKSTLNEEDLRPSWMKYMVEHEPIKILWGALVVLGSLIVAIREFLR